MSFYKLGMLSTYFQKFCTVISSRPELGPVGTYNIKAEKEISNIGT
jgi:hypothetical protein